MTLKASYIEAVTERSLKHIKYCMHHVSHAACPDPLLILALSNTLPQDHCNYVQQHLQIS